MHKKMEDAEQQADWVPVQPGLFTYPVPAGKKPALYANQCQTCSGIYFPKRDICPVCFTNGDLVDKEISGCGTVYTSSIVQIPSPSGIRPPYACGYVDMALENEDESIRLYALFTDPDPVKIACGQTVELVIDEVRRDDHARAVMAHVFRPVDKD